MFRGGVARQGTNDLQQNVICCQDLEDVRQILTRFYPEFGYWVFRNFTRCESMFAMNEFFGFQPHRCKNGSTCEQKATLAVVT